MKMKHEAVKCKMLGGIALLVEYSIDGLYGTSYVSGFLSLGLLFSAVDLSM